jgi:hypothetical protein
MDMMIAFQALTNASSRVRPSSMFRITVCCAGGNGMSKEMQMFSHLKLQAVNCLLNSGAFSSFPAGF